MNRAVVFILGSILFACLSERLLNRGDFLQAVRIGIRELQMLFTMEDSGVV